MKWAVVFVLAVAVGVPAVAQSAGKSDVFNAKDVDAQIAALVAKAQANGSAGDTLADYGSHKIQISVRTVSGGAEVHAHFDDVMLVKQGTATLITGGTVVDAIEGPGGETHGKSIEGGVTRTVSPGDIITVNAGVPHQLIVPAGTTYVAFVIKVRE
jgi:mannose-6-phosphate isomerase-like protein (cupin superfamily)